MPPITKIHPVFHVSLLKPHKGELPKDPTTLPSHFIDNHPILKPTAILDRRDKQSNDTFTPQVLIQWEGCPPEEATWEDLTDIEDKVVFYGERNVVIHTDDPKKHL